MRHDLLSRFSTPPTLSSTAFRQEWELLDSLGNTTHGDGDVRIPASESRCFTGAIAVEPADEDETTGTLHWYVYDAWNRLVEVWQDDGDGSQEISGQTPDDPLYDRMAGRMNVPIPFACPDGARAGSGFAGGSGW